MRGVNKSIIFDNLLVGLRVSRGGEQPCLSSQQDGITGSSSNSKSATALSLKCPQQNLKWRNSKRARHREEDAMEGMTPCTWGRHGGRNSTTTATPSPSPIPIHLLRGMTSSRAHGSETWLCSHQLLSLIMWLTDSIISLLVVVLRLMLIIQRPISAYAATCLCCRPDQSLSHIWIFGYCKWSSLTMKWLLL